MTAHAELERWAFGLLAASLALVQFNLAAAQIAFGLSALLWLRLAVADGVRPAVPGFFPPLLVFAALTVLSAAFSVEPATSLVDTKQLVLFLMVPMTLRLARGDRATTVLNVIIAAGAIGAMVGVVQGTMLGFDSLANRPEGSLTHYMTYSGVIMLVLSATVARLLYATGPIIWPAIAVPALVVALTLTWTRNAWIGALAAAVALVAIRRPRLLLLVPVAVGVLLLVAPSGIRARVWSIGDVNDESNRDRIQMIVMGAEMVRDHPVFGVGPDMIRVVYPQYRPPDAVHPTNPHLHNVPVNIAAERGLPALAAWLWFIVAAAWSPFQRIRQGHSASPLAAAGFAAIVAMLTAGLFEYNFGDSEFLMLFLGLITLADAATHEPRGVGTGTRGDR